MQKKKSKKQLAWLLSATMLLSGFPAQQTEAAKTISKNKAVNIVERKMGKSFVYFCDGKKFKKMIEKNSGMISWF